MKNTNICLALVLLACLPGLSGSETGTECYVKKATWQESLAAAWEAANKREAEKPAAAAPAKPDDEWGPWYYIGTFQTPGKSSFTEAFPPEKECDFTKPVGKLRWKAHPEWDDGVCHELHAGSNTATYLCRIIKAKTPKTVTGYFGSDDGMVAWLNGKKLISHDVPRGVEPNSDQAKLELVAGENKLLFKVHNQSGSCGFYFSTSPTPGANQGHKGQAREALWELVQRDFPDGEARKQMAWERQDKIWDKDWPGGDVSALTQRYAQATAPLLAAQARDLAAKAKDAKDLAAVRQVYHRSKAMEEATAQFKDFNLSALRLAIEDLVQTYGPKYAKGKEYLARLAEIEKAAGEVSATGQKSDPARFAQVAEQCKALRKEALLANPLLDFQSLLLVKRSPKQLGMPQNWQGNCALARNGYDNEIAVLSPVSPEGKLSTLYKPKNGEFVGDIVLHFDADKMAFSMPGSNNKWQVWEMKSDGTGLRQVTSGEYPDVDNYYPCYLPNGKIIFSSTGCFQGVPCVGGANWVANLYIMDADGKNMRQLCFDQDHDWYPFVMNDGRVMYTRWEYSDTAHYFTRILMRMNPDGTGQMELYGSESYWPNSIFYAKPIPDSATKFVAIVSGHHGVPRMGEMLLFDAERGRHEADGVIQRIPGYGKKVEPIIKDQLVNDSWPKFLHPYPLSDKYFLAASQPKPNMQWAIYLVDVFDNMFPLAEVPGYALLEPIPLRKRPTPPIVPEKVKPDTSDAYVYLTDIYEGPGLKGIPRGTVKKLRISEPHYTYPHMGGHINVGVEGPWDVRRIHGTVPVYEDGSAAFTIPANTPITVQPLDEQGRALQIMRSWFVAMPGESISCVGCHERQNTAPEARRPIAMTKPLSEITPWYGPARGFSFKRDMQPVLDKFCVGCHNGQPYEGKNTLDFAAKPKNGWGNFTPSYLALHPFVRRPCPESDDHIQEPMEFHISTSELVQMLEKGHYNVKLDAEAWDRLATWIDQNVPDHGTWTEHRQIPGNYHQRRLEMRTKYAFRPEDPETIPDIKHEPVQFAKPEPLPAVKKDELACPSWPFDAAEAEKRQKAAGTQTRQTIDLGDGVKMEMALIPAGEFVMGSNDGYSDERPLCRVKVDKPFYMGVTELNNRQYNQFDAQHNSGYMDQQHKDHTTPGYPANLPDQPVIRVTWVQAVQFCTWLSQKAGRPFTLPTEAQWEWACRAGTNTPFFYGGLDTDFSPYANLADASIKLLAVDGVNPQPVKNPNAIFQDFMPRDSRFNDGEKIQATVGKYKPNPWGLQDMHGNVWQWTRSTFKPYPYNDSDGRNDLKSEGLKVARGGSWADRPYRARSAFRLAYQSFQPVYNVGFRVVSPAGEDSRTSVEPAGAAGGQVTAGK